MFSPKKVAGITVCFSAVVFAAGCNSNNNLRQGNSARPTGENSVAVVADATKPEGGTTAPSDVPSGTTLSGTDASGAPTGKDKNRQAGMPQNTPSNRPEAEGSGTGSAVGSGSDGVGGQIPSGDGAMKIAPKGTGSGMPMPPGPSRK